LRAKKIVNDRREPDTSQRLLTVIDSSSGLKIKVRKQVIKLGYKVKTNVESRVDLKKGPGRPKGSKNIERNALVSYQSYRHFNNSCYYTSVLEVLSVCSRACSSKKEVSRSRRPRHQLIVCLGSPIFQLTNIFIKISDHFEQRRKKTEAGTAGPLTRELNRGRDMMMRWITHEKKPSSQVNMACQPSSYPISSKTLPSCIIHSTAATPMYRLNLHQYGSMVSDCGNAENSALRKHARVPAKGLQSHVWVLLIDVISGVTITDLCISGSYRGHVGADFGALG
jgi:hypothetical protein